MMMILGNCNKSRRFLQNYFELLWTIFSLSLEPRCIKLIENSQQTIVAYAYKTLMNLSFSSTVRLL